MTASHQSQVPPTAYDYFRRTQPGTVPGSEYREPVLIAQTFSPELGWRNQPSRKRVSRSWLQGLRLEGRTHVALEFRGRRADFAIAELLTTKAVPIFAGRLI